MASAHSRKRCTKFAVLFACVANIYLLSVLKGMNGGRNEQWEPIDVTANDYGSDGWDLHRSARATAAKWKLTAPESVALLEKAASNLSVGHVPEDDVIVFFHPWKTGGTSFSMLLENTTGGVVPGSRSSDYFNVEEFQNQIKLDLGGAINDTSAVRMWWKSKRVVYSHHRFRDYQQPIKKTYLGQLLTSFYPHDQRFRMVTMLRDPLELRASSFFEWVCWIGYWIEISPYYAHKFNLPQNNTDLCFNLTMDQVTKIRFISYERYCDTRGRDNGMENCDMYVNNKVDPKPYCTSVPALLDSYRYWQILHDMFYYGTITRTNLTGVADYERGALEYFGGLDRVDDAAMEWFGITERMEESICLFHYQFRIPHAITTPRQRYKTCRPTTFWSAVDRDIVRQREDLDYAVFRVGNAILDIRLAKMQQEIKEALVRGETLNSMPYLSSSCYDLVMSNNVLQI